MSADEIDPALPFTRVYVQRGEASLDSKKLRARLGRYVQTVFTDDELFGARMRLGTELGPAIQHGQLERFITNCSLHDLLDGITYIFTALKDLNRSASYQRGFVGWHNFVDRVLREENIGYRINAHGAVRYAVDEEFDRTRESTIDALGTKRYEAARDSFQKGLESIVDDGGLAIRHVFDALENVTKLALNGQISRLEVSVIQANLKPKIIAGLGDREKNATNSMLSSLADWIVAAHQYRHAGGEETPEPPTLGFATLMVSSGASFLRWLVELDRRINPSSAKQHGGP